MRSAVTALLSLGILGGLLLTPACRKPPRLGDPLDGLSVEQRDQFNRGSIQFERVFIPETGLGPLFNADACAECHESPVSGGPGDEVEVHAAAFLQESAFCDPLAGKGGPVIQQFSTPALKVALGIDSEPFPMEATGRGLRTTPDLFGFGLLDAVPEATILALADPDDRVATVSQDVPTASSTDDSAGSVVRRLSRRCGNSTMAPSPSSKVLRTRRCLKKTQSRETQSRPVLIPFQNRRSTKRIST